jgi:hypothetical protein
MGLAVEVVWTVENNVDWTEVEVVWTVENNVDWTEVEVVWTVENNVDWTDEGGTTGVAEEAVDDEVDWAVDDTVDWASDDEDDEFDAGGTIGGTTGGKSDGSTPGKVHDVSEPSRAHLAIVPASVAAATASELAVKKSTNSWASAAET